MMDRNAINDVLNVKQAFFKRSFDIVFALFGLFLTWWIILLAFSIASIDTKTNGFFTQVRVGRFGKLFRIIKIRTMRNDLSHNTTVTTSNDPRITLIGRYLRKLKIDELPQLVNVLFGQMSFVGPRPDVPGFADLLEGEAQIILCVRPGITGPASLKYRDEEKLLRTVKNPEQYNEEIIFKDKVRINKEYIKNYNLLNDIKYILDTLKYGFSI